MIYKEISQHCLWNGSGNVISVCGLLNTSYREEYSFWVNSKDTVIATWRPNVTYLPEQPDMVWKLQETLNPEEKKLKSIDR